MARIGKEKAVESKAYGDIMLSALKERGLKQMDLADRLGVRQSTVSGHINRKRIGLEVFTAVMNAMGYDLVVMDRETGEERWVVADK